MSVSMSSRWAAVGGHVAVALDLRAVVRIDGGPGAAEPRLPVPQGLERRADTVPVDALRKPLGSGRALPREPGVEAGVLDGLALPAVQAAVPQLLPQPHRTSPFFRRELPQRG